MYNRKLKDSEMYKLRFAWMSSFNTVYTSLPVGYPASVNAKE